MAEAEAKTKSIRAYNFMYVQQLQYLPTKSPEKLFELIEDKLNTTRFALIVHDNDTDTNGNPVEPHVHAMLCFRNARSLNSIAKLLGDKPQSIAKWDNDADKGFAYLIHQTKKARKEGKYQYRADKVMASFDYPALMESMKTDSAEVGPQRQFDIGTYLNILYKGQITKDDLLKMLNGVEYAQYHKQVEDVWQKRLRDLADEWRKEKVKQGAHIRVIWIYGPAGVGKTSLAREYAEKAGQQYFVSGSSKDPFTNYKGEHTVILDEFRPNVMPYSDLLRICDPFGIDSQVMAPARYYDKALACDIIIITSPYDPHTFYENIGKSKKVNKDIDSFGQLLRRLSLIIQMDAAHIWAAEYDSLNECFSLIQGTERQNTYSYLTRPAPSVNSLELYNSIFE